MSELRALLASSSALRQAGRPFLLATVVGVQGSSYRRPGARMILADDAVVAGSVSAGCLEADLVRRGWWRTDGRAAALVTYDSVSSDDDLGWGLGLGCNGVVELLLERSDAGLPDPLAWHARCLAAERSGCLVTVVRSDDPALVAPARLALDHEGRVVEGAALVGPDAEGAALGGPDGERADRAGSPVIPAGAAREWLLAQARRALGDGVTRAVRSPDGSIGA
ncbi:MAG: XdhC family protein, partial [Myxococcales bacterium]